MKNVFKLIGIVALIAVIGFAMIACPSPGGSRGPVPDGGDPKTNGDPLARYISYGDDGTKYELVITEAATGRAAYTPKNGDVYTLTITFTDGTWVKSSGSVASAESSVKIILTHSSGETITVELTGDGISIKSFSGDIPVDNKTGNDNKVPRPPELNHSGTPGLAYELINNDTAYRVSKGTVTAGDVIIPAWYNSKPVTEIRGRDNRYEDETAAFLGTKITSVIIGVNIKTVGGYAFSLCESLVSIIIPEGVTSIGVQAFSGCTSLTSITIPKSVTYINSFAFADCTLTSIRVASGNPNYASQDGILYNNAKTEIIIVPQTISGSVVIPAGVTSIGRETFYGWTSSQTINIQGIANQSAADNAWAWGSSWRYLCNATINYNG